MGRGLYLCKFEFEVWVGETMMKFKCDPLFTIQECFLCVSCWYDLWEWREKRKVKKDFWLNVEIFFSMESKRINKSISKNFMCSENGKKFTNDENLIGIAERGRFRMGVGEIVEKSFERIVINRSLITQFRRCFPLPRAVHTP